MAMCGKIVNLFKTSERNELHENSLVSIFLINAVLSQAVAIVLHLGGSLLTPHY